MSSNRSVEAVVRTAEKDDEEEEEEEERGRVMAVVEASGLRVRKSSAWTPLTCSRSQWRRMRRQG